MGFDREMSRLYARALMRIARADNQISLEEGLRLKERIATRCDVPLGLDDLLMEPPLRTEELAMLGGEGPFRSSIDTVAFARILVEDGVAVVLAKGYVSEQEATVLRRLVGALGVSEPDFLAISAGVARWLPR
jgi:tellurite resistance protein TerB